MKELSIKRALSDATKQKEIEICGTAYSLHINLHGDEVVITDLVDYDRIYSVQSIDFYKMTQAAG